MGLISERNKQLHISEMCMMDSRQRIDWDGLTEFIIHAHSLLFFKVDHLDVGNSSSGGLKACLSVMYTFISASHCQSSFTSASAFRALLCLLE